MEITVTSLVNKETGEITYQLEFFGPQQSSGVRLTENDFKTLRREMSRAIKDTERAKNETVQS